MEFESQETETVDNGIVDCRNTGMGDWGKQVSMLGEASRLEALHKIMQGCNQIRVS